MAGLARVVELPVPAETRNGFRDDDSWCRLSTIELRSGIRLGVTECQFEPSFSFAAPQPASEIDLIVSKGGVLRTRLADGSGQPRAGHALQLGRTRRPTQVQVRPESDARTECVSLSMSEHRLRELLGVSELPAPFREVTESRELAPLISRDMTSGLYRLLEEIVNADAKGPSRMLWHERTAPPPVGPRHRPAPAGQVAPGGKSRGAPNPRRAGPDGRLQRDAAQERVQGAVRHVRLRPLANRADGGSAAPAGGASPQRQRGRDPRGPPRAPPAEGRGELEGAHDAEQRGADDVHDHRRGRREEPRCPE
jgi:hypothetical protein